MAYIMVDVESDGPIPGDYSMVCFGAVVVENELGRSFFGRTQPISEKWLPEALAISGYSRHEHMTFDDPREVMLRFERWLELLGLKRIVFISDNNGYDWSFINWYFHHYLGSNPFGFSSQNLNSLYKGLTKNPMASFKHLRTTEHTHHPVDDARGNAESLLRMNDEYGLNLRLT
ncbi:MAG: exonuclease [Clostridia bacterium]|nr:exonuclease [Deltaproteobacteria bacterium]